LLKNWNQQAELASAAKAGIDFAAYTARLEAAPFQNKVKSGVSSATVKSALILWHIRHGFKPRPFKTRSKATIFSKLLRHCETAQPR
jgi:hypothetical protein